MPILMIMDIEGATAEQYDGVDELLGGLTPENAPAGLISHAAAVTDTGIMVADVWESAEDLQRFFDEKLGAAIAEAGLPRAEPRIVPVHNHIEGRGEEAGVLVLIELDGFTIDDYDALTADMEAHAGDGSAQRCARAALKSMSWRRTSGRWSACWVGKWAISCARCTRSTALSSTLRTRRAASTAGG
jgi:hypothetical protein